jgi:hypothetical protein
VYLSLSDLGSDGVFFAYVGMLVCVGDVYGGMVMDDIGMKVKAFFITGLFWFAVMLVSQEILRVWEWIWG